MPVVLKLLDRSGEPLTGDIFLADYDIEAHDGRGWATCTSDITQAHRFPNAYAALESWRRQSVTRPLRDDGRPNRPLTAFTVELVQL